MLQVNAPPFQLPALEPAARIAQPPTIITTDKEVSEEAITYWQPPAGNIDGSTQ